MFLNQIKEFSLKRILKKSFLNNNQNLDVKAIKSVGLLINEKKFLHKTELIDELVNNGFKKENIKILVFNDKINSNQVLVYPTFSLKHVSLSGKFNENVVKDFINEKFDLLISYYDIEKKILMIVTNNSNAKFKAGFANIDKRCNDLLIATDVQNFKIFVSELFKYLKILKKI